METTEPSTPFDLSATEFSLLELTNEETWYYTHDFDYPPDRFSRRKLILSTKATYYWGTVITGILEENKEVSEEDILTAYRGSVRANVEAVRAEYAELPSFSPDENTKGLKQRLLSGFLERLEASDFDISSLEARTREAYSRLLRRGLIEDPVFSGAGGLLIAALGFVPYGFTRKTRKGEVVSKRIRSVCWSYEYRKEGDDEKVRLRFRLMKVLGAFKRALAEVTEEENMTFEDPDSE